MLLDVVSAALRALAFVAMFSAAGTAVFAATFHAQPLESWNAIRRAGRIAARLGVLLVLAHLALEPARMAGEWDGALDTSLLRRTVLSMLGAAAGLRCLGLLLVFLGLRGASSVRWRLATTGAALVAISFLLAGHTATSAARVLLAPVLLVHVGIVAYWFGALAPLHRVALRETPAVAGAVVARFSALAARLVPAIFGAGLVMACVLLPDLAALRAPYGLLLLAKVAGFAMLMALAGFNKWRLGPAIARGDARGTRLFRRVVLVEYVLLASVLATTAVMTGFFSPE